MKANYRKIIGLVKFACLALLTLVFSNQSRADFQTNIISGFATNYSFFPTGFEKFDALFILNGGSVSSGPTRIGYESGANSNLVVVSGIGSAWTNVGAYIGFFGSGNRLVISDGGRVVSSLGMETKVGGHSNFNSVLVTGGGSVWTNWSLLVGDGGAFCSMVVSNGGSVFAYTDGYVGGTGGGQSNTVMVTGADSIWSNRSRLYIGISKGENTLIVSNGGTVLNAEGIIGYSLGSDNNRVLVTGSGSVWRSARLLVGYGQSFPNGPTNNQLMVADGGLVLASNLYVGLLSVASNNLLSVSGGNLTVTNLSGTGTLDIRRGRLVFNGGTITSERLWLTNGVGSISEFNSGTLHTKGTVVSNAQPFVIGDGVGSANLHLAGGVHSFQNGTLIRTNSFLTGCGTINGGVVVDAGGAIQANCTNLVFNSSVTNHGAMVVDGAALETFGTFVNNGKIYLINGGTTNFHGAFINNGAIINGDVRLSIARDGNGLFVSYTGVPTVTYRLQRAPSASGPWSDAATNTAPASGLVEYHEITPLPDRAFYRAASQ